MIPQLGEVNLVVGRNNAGKSTLLHALRLYASAGDPSVLSSLVLGGPRGRRARMQLARDPEGFSGVLSNLFHRSATGGLVHHITAGPLGSRLPQLELTLRPIKRKTDEGYSLFEDSEEDNGSTATMYEAGLVVQFGTSRQLYPWEFLLEGSPRYSVQRGLPRTKPVAYVSANGLTPATVAEYWDRVALTEYEETAVDGLRLIAPDVERISVVGAGSETSERSVLVKLRGQKSPLPLSQMGDGMIRILGMILTLSTVRGGMLLLDEVENGIHYSAQADLWRLIFRLSAALRTQIFATTHSWDCIQAFQEAAHESRLRAALIRIDSEPSGNKATTFVDDELAIVTQEHIEVR